MNIINNLKKDTLTLTDLKRKAVKYFILHFGAVFIFAFLYYIMDVIEAKYPKFGHKYLGVTKKLDKERGGKAHHNPKFMYFLWYSLITQTTVGYGGVLNNKGASIPITDLDNAFKVLNYIQLFSIFTIPIISLIWG